jgi:hypothetical protein
VAVVVLDEGPIAHADIERYDEPGLDAAVEDYGVATHTASYRLLLLEVDSILETRWFPKSKWVARPDLVHALVHRQPVPPIVVYRARGNSEAFGLIDGVNRTFAHWSAGLASIRAYELVTTPTS